MELLNSDIIQKLSGDNLLNHYSDWIAMFFEFHVWPNRRSEEDDSHDNCKNR
jgi:hypothetical protein